MPIYVRYPEQRCELHPDGLCAIVDEPTHIASVQQFMGDCRKKYSPLLQQHGIIAFPRKKVTLGQNALQETKRINDDATGGLMHWDADPKSFQSQITIMHSEGSAIPTVLADPYRTWNAEREVLQDASHIDAITKPWLRDNLHRHRKAVLAQMQIPDLEDVLRDILRLRMLFVVGKAHESPELYDMSRCVQQQLQNEESLHSVDLEEHSVVVVGNAIHAREVLWQKKRGNAGVRVLVDAFQNAS